LRMPRYRAIKNAPAAASLYRHVGSGRHGHLVDAPINPD
jgi:hypothetical protein